MIGTASLARGYSGYLGSLFDIPKANHSMEGSLVPEFMHGYVTHFDSLAFILTMLVTGLLLLGVQVSSKFQITFATINLSVACFIFVCGLFKADFHNWNLSKSEIPASAGEGGFLPFGFTGVIAGAGTCFFAFVGFDGIAATAEEVKNPRKAIPNSILWTSGIIFITYCCMATIQTLIWPYWDQKQAAPLPYIFEKLGMHFAKWTVLVGVLAGLSTSFVGGFLPLPRILYAMARDGVIYRVLAIVSKRFKVPFVATIIGGILIACLASMLEIDQLADMLSIGTLAAYSLVSISVLLLRYEYRKPTNCENPLPITYQDHLISSELKSKGGLKNGEEQQNNNNNNKNDSETTRKKENITLAVNGILTLDDKINKEKKNAKVDELVKENNNGAFNENKKQQVKKSDSKSSANNNNSSKGTISDSNESSRSSGSSSNDDSSVISNGASSSSVHQSSSYSLSGSISSRSLLSLFVDGTKGPDNEIRRPDEQTTHISRVMILLLVLVTTLLDYALVIWGPTLYLLEPIAVSTCGFLFLVTILMTLLLNRLPVAEPSINSFEVPMVPTIPLFSVIINTYLMLNLSGKYKLVIFHRERMHLQADQSLTVISCDNHPRCITLVMTWIRFAVWMALGFFIYFTYGIFKSTGYKDSRCD